MQIWTRSPTRRCSRSIRAYCEARATSGCWGITPEWSSATCESGNFETADARRCTRIKADKHLRSSACICGSKDSVYPRPHDRVGFGREPVLSGNEMKLYVGGMLP